MDKLKLTLILIVSSFVLAAQDGPVAFFDMDNCTVEDQTGNFNSGTVSNGVDCDCGVGDSSSAFYFNGSQDSIELDSALKDLFLGDFTISFYLWMENVSDITSIMSVQGECGSARDSAFFIRYFPNSNEIVMELSKNFGEIVTLRSPLPENQCWNNIIITRQGRIYSLYINGEFVDQDNFIDQVVLGQDYPFLIGVTACSGINDLYFSGRIDDLRLFDYALTSDLELDSEQLFPDRILTADTTIFEGSSVLLRTGPSCTPNVSWSPATFLDDDLLKQPTATPDQTITYQVSFNHGSCISTDEVTISVLLEDDIRCGNILLPKAFTPNSDALNDRFGISNNFIVEDIQRFEIYNKWGLKLFETFDKADSWDGAYKGEALPPGTYVYKLEYTCMSESFKRTGTFNILK